MLVEVLDRRTGESALYELYDPLLQATPAGAGWTVAVKIPGARGVVWRVSLLPGRTHHCTVTDRMYTLHDSSP
jgi:hypothetical protein